MLTAREKRARYPEATQPVTIRISKSLLEQIDAYATTHGLTRSAAVALMAGHGFVALTGNPVPARKLEAERVFAATPPAVTQTRKLAESVRAMTRQD